MWPAKLARSVAQFAGPQWVEAKLIKSVYLSPCTAICIRFVTVDKWMVKSLAVHASLAGSWKRDSDRSRGCSAKAYGWSSCCVSEILCVPVLTVDMKLVSVYVSRSPVDHFQVQTRNLLVPDILPRCWVVSDWCLADTRLFMFVYLLSGSLNFSTRQLNPYRATSFIRAAFLLSVVSSS